MESDKKLLVIVMIMVLFFAAFFIGRVVFPTGGAVTIDELHKENIEGDSKTGYTYNGFSFVNIKGIWYTQVQTKDSLLDVPLHFGPKELENIPVTGSVDDRFKKTYTYITFDPLGEKMGYVALASAELSLNLVRGIGVMPIAACDRNRTSACVNRPIRTCDTDEPVIYLDQQKNETEVRLEGNCVWLRGKGEELVKATDRFLLQWYGVMK